jgi:hypothetical protein
VPERRLVKLHIASVPAGAEIYRADGVRLGETPFDVELEPVRGDAVYTLKLAGHKPARVVLPADRDGAREVARARAPRPPAGPRPPGRRPGELIEPD